MSRRSLLMLRCLLAVALLFALLLFVPVREIVDVLKVTSLGLFAAGVVAQISNRLLATLPLGIITANQGVDLGRGTLFRILLAVQFYALFLPGALAGGGATWLKYLEHGADASAAASTVVINRAVALLMLVPVVSLGFALDPRIGALPPLLTLCLIVACVLCAVLIWHPWPGGARMTVVGRGRWRATIAALAGRLAVFHGMPAGDKATVLVGAVVCELGNVVAMWAFARAVNTPVDFVTVLWMRGLLQAALLLPLSIAGVGVREASLLGLGALVGVPAAAAVAWSFVILAGSTVVALVGGVLEAAPLLRSIKRRAGGLAAETPPVNRP